MSHWGQEKKLRDVRKATIIVISRKTFQEEEKELKRKEIFTASSAADGTRTRTPLLHICAH
jgi:hypothetical protein